MQAMISPQFFLDKQRRSYNQSFRTPRGGDDAPSELKRLLNEPIWEVIENCTTFENNYYRAYKNGRVEDRHQDSPYIDDWEYPDHHMHKARIMMAQEDLYLLARAKNNFKKLNEAKKRN